MYVKPKLERFGSVRELTRIGLYADCDGGVFGTDNGGVGGCGGSGGGDFTDGGRS